MVHSTTFTVNVFFVYIDWTLEDIPRAFYVGKGTKIRLGKRERNAYWKSIRNKYGWRREAILATKDETHAFEQEKHFIAFFNTFENGEKGRWGANLTEGGEGVSGRPAWNKGIKTGPLKIDRPGRKQSPESKAKIAAALRGRPKTREHVENVVAVTRGQKRAPLSKERVEALASLHRGKPKSVEHREKIAAAQRGKPKKRASNEGCDSSRRNRIETSPVDESNEQINASVES